MIRLFLVLLSLVSFMNLAQAADFGIEAGFRSQSGDHNTAGVTTSSKTNYQLGGVGQFELSEPWRIRSGLMYTQRSLEFTPNAEATLTYFDVPVQVMYKFEDYGAAFLGPVVSMLLEKKCSVSGSTCEIRGAKSMLLPIQLGATFKFAPQLGATIFYETIPGNVSDDLSNYRAVGANLLFTFD